MRIVNWAVRIVVLAAVVAACWYWGPRIYRKYFAQETKAPFVPTTKVRYGEFVISLHELGNLQAEKSVTIASEIEGRIIKLIQEGIIVKPGDVLVELDGTNAERQVREAELKYENQRAQVDKAKAELDLLKQTNRTEVEQQDAQLNFDKSELKRAEQQLEKKKRLAAEKLIPGTDVDAADLEVRAKELAVLKGTKQLELKKREAESKERQKDGDVKNVEFQAAMAKGDLDRAKRDLGRTILKAPASGLVVINKTWTGEGHAKFKAGDLVYPRYRIIQLPDLSSMQVVSQVGEAEAPSVALGMPVLIRLDAVPGRVYHGTVKDVASLAAEADPWSSSAATPGKKQFEVTIAVKESDPARIKPGMTADAEFMIARIPGATYVPIEAVFEKEGKAIVYVKQGSRFVPVEVKTGRENDNFVTIGKGLRKGQLVALRDPTRPLEEEPTGGEGRPAKEKAKSAAPIPEPGG